MRFGRGVVIKWLVSACFLMALHWGRSVGAGDPASDTSSAAQAIDPQVRDAIHTVFPALVRIIVVTGMPDQGRLQKFEAAGSGVIISTTGYVVTNHHVAGTAEQIFCDLPDGERLDASVVGTDPLSDICVIKLQLDHRKPGAAAIVAASWGDSDALAVGDVVFAMGSPAALSQSVTKGIVSNPRMGMPQLLWPFTLNIDGEEVGSLVRWVGHDASLYGGNSGGPLVDIHGRVIGIDEIGLGSVGGAIPANLAKAVATQIIEHGSVRRGWVGIDPQPRLHSQGDQHGVLVGGVIDGSPAARAGISAGDLITSFDGHPCDCALVDDLPVFNQMVCDTAVGREVSVQVVHEHASRNVSLVAEPWERTRGSDREIKPLGVTARDLTRLSALTAQRSDRTGVQVITVRPGGPCGVSNPPLERDDVIVALQDHPVRNIADLRKVIRELTTGKTDSANVVVSFIRQQQELLTVAKLGVETLPDDAPRAQHAWLGATAQVVGSELAEALGIPGQKGVRVTRVYPGTGAEKADLRVGDVITNFAGQDVDTSEAEEAEIFLRMVRDRQIGEQVDVKIKRRQGDQWQALLLKPTLDTPPMPSDELRSYRDEDFEFTAREVSFEDVSTGAVRSQTSGMLIIGAENAGWAQLAHMAIGDVLLSVSGTPTPDAPALRRAIEHVKAQRPRHVVFFIKRGFRTMFLETEPNWSAIKD